MAWFLYKWSKVHKIAPQLTWGNITCLRQFSKLWAAISLRWNAWRRGSRERSLHPSQTHSPPPSYGYSSMERRNSLSHTKLWALIFPCSLLCVEKPWNLGYFGEDKHGLLKITKQVIMHSLGPTPKPTCLMKSGVKTKLCTAIVIDCGDLDTGKSTQYPSIGQFHSQAQLSVVCSGAGLGTRL